MRIKTICILVCLVVFAIDAYSSEETDSLYKILRIKTSGDYYVIHAQRNDSLFKIISKKVLLNKPNLELIKRGNFYNLDFTFFDKADTTKLELAGISNYLHVKRGRVFIDGETKIKFTKRFHHRLYTAKNLTGLYYISR